MSSKYIPNILFDGLKTTMKEPVMIVSNKDETCYQHTDRLLLIIKDLSSDLARGSGNLKRGNS
jgi:hypothetical protein